LPVLQTVIATVFRRFSGSGGQIRDFADCRPSAPVAPNVASTVPCQLVIPAAFPFVDGPIGNGRALFSLPPRGAAGGPVPGN